MGELVFQTLIHAPNIFFLFPFLRRLGFTSLCRCLSGMFAIQPDFPGHGEAHMFLGDTGRSRFDLAIKVL